MLGEIIAQGSDVVRHFSTTPMVKKDWVKKRAMFMMAPVTQWRYKKETVLTTPVTEPSLAWYIYILVKPVLTS